MKTEHSILYAQALEVFEFAHAKIETNPSSIISNFESIVKKHFKDITSERLAEIMAMPFEDWRKLFELYVNKKPLDKIQLSQTKEPKPLHLVLQRVYFDQILEGSKTSEYRDKKAFYDSRLMRNGEYRNFSHVVFQEGYHKDARRMKVEIKKIKLHRNFYEIYLGKIVEKSF